MSARPWPVLSPLEARVVAVLFEKRCTVPDTYPLTLNALVAGCNQKTSRDPVMDAAPAEVQAAVDQLRRMSLVVETSGSRVMRYAENIKAVLQVPSESVALLATLILRGPQTAAELRSHCERMRRFSDLSALEGFLGELAGWSAGPMVVELPRQSGARECRWAHLLCGPVRSQEPVAGPAAAGEWAPSAGAPAAGDARLERLERHIASLAEEIDALKDRIDRLEAGADAA